MKGLIKFLIAAGVIVLLGTAALYAIREWRYRNDPEYQVVKNFQELERRYAEDQYGGETPEETLRLFIDALKKEDVDLATKYFVIDEQKKWRNELLIIKEKGLLDEMVKDLERPREKKPLIENTDNRFNYFIYNDDNILAVVIDIARGPNGKWKILDL
ncbi:MAG: hypothetical protein A3C07_02195 [Candidatus Sungbacteria bacterium RIFCSPHIGHO2_02_FULL_47_11]|uniref:DUF4878 domain-containing protein n=1 Tax=Candidatus Sungbacteria bacterium RIFCSPHIGHO2_02_FULL_47_11 TaxID=1802270 RepID=A0A1G2KKJ9_9BACT|nr:MAG: hypothetical protein A3C07_02195 [Candidatus Sungbacteria bacterium RIFCSPHIGHO2_02_FULL_47_11]